MEQAQAPLRRHLPADPFWVLSLFLLLSVGTIAIFSSSSLFSLRTLNDEYFYIKKHGAFLIIGLAFFFACQKIKISFFRKMTYPCLLFSWFLLWMTLIPGLSHKAGGAARWLALGPILFQPSELFKFSFILYIAHSLAKKNESVVHFSKGFLPHVIVAAIGVLPLLLQPDLGTAVIILFLTVVMLFVAGALWRHLILLLVCQLPVWLILIATSPYRMRRILAFLDPWADMQNKGYQIIQSMVAFYNGGATGVGWGNSQGKLFYLPAAHTDFILAVLGEELGFLGVVGLLCLFLLFFMRTIRISSLTKDLFQKYLVIGIALEIMIQMLTNSMVVMGVLPTKGLTLPFISYGGSSIVMLLFMCGVVYNVAAQSQQK